MEGSEVSAVEKGKLLLSRRQAGVEEVGFLNDFPRRVSVCQLTGCTAMSCLFIILATYTTHILLLIMYDSICVYIQILLEMPNVTPVRVFQMECALLEALQNKKTRRDIFRDFLGQYMHTVCDIGA